MATVALLVGLAVVVMSSGATAASDCHKVSGKFTLTAVSGPACASPVGVCATAEFSGGLKGTSVFTGTSIVPTADTATTGVVLLTGDTTIQARDGALSSKDAVTLRTTGAGEFAEVDTIIGGTGGLAGATGVLTATGTFTAAGGGNGVYQGELCVP
jgi:hypothetical protein